MGGSTSTWMGSPRTSVHYINKMIERSVFRSYLIWTYLNHVLVNIKLFTLLNQPAKHFEWAKGHSNTLYDSKNHILVIGLPRRCRVRRRVTARQCRVSPCLRRGTPPSTTLPLYVDREHYTNFAKREQRHGESYRERMLRYHAPIHR